MRINTNMAALNSHRMLQNSSMTSAKNLEKLSSGKRINRASDDAAGLAISEKMNAQIRGLKMASRNALDGVSLVQTAEGAMGEVHAMLQRMRELSVQAANGTMSTEDRRAIQDEINQLTSEVNRIGNGTEFNKLNILQGNQGPNSNTIISKMSTGAPAELVIGGIVTSPFNENIPFQALTETDTLSVVVNGKENIVNLQGFSNTTNLSYADFLERVNDALGDDAVAYFNDNGSILVKTNQAGGGQTIEFKGSSTTLDKLFITSYVDNFSLTQSYIPAQVGPPVVAAVPARYAFDINNNIVNGDKIQVQNETFTFVRNLSNPPASNEVLLGNDLSSTFINLELAISASTNYNAQWMGGNTFSLTQHIPNPAPLEQPVIFHSTKAFGVAENPANNSQGIIFFSEMPEKGSFITIGNTRIDFYDSSEEPYAGTNVPIDLKSAGGDVNKLVEDLINNLNIDGVKLTEVPGNSRTINIKADAVGFAGNVITLEGTLKDFNVNLQVGANAGQGFRLEVGDTRALALKISADKPTGNPGVAGAAYAEIPNVTNGIKPAFVEYSLDVMDEDKATAAIEVFNNAIITVASERSRLGAIQNRLEKTIANLDNTAENLTAARSRIEDTDMALEMSEFTKFNILQQAGTSMLAQANQQPQMMLQLLNS